MLDLINGWNKLDEENEEKIYNGVRYVRPINKKTYSLSCKICNNVISSTDDMQSLKENDCCQYCVYINLND